MWVYETNRLWGKGKFCTRLLIAHTQGMVKPKYRPIRKGCACMLSVLSNWLGHVISERYLSRDGCIGRNRIYNCWWDDSASDSLMTWVRFSRTHKWWEDGTDSYKLSSAFEPWGTCTIVYEVIEQLTHHPHVHKQINKIKRIICTILICRVQSKVCSPKINLTF